MIDKQRPFRISAGYLAAVVVIYVLTACSWLILGFITSHRTQQKDSDLRTQVGQLWGGPHSQVAPSVVLDAIPEPKPTSTGASPAATSPAATSPAGASPTGASPAAASIDAACRPELELRPEQTRARVRLDLEHRRKGLLWYATYRVRFDGSYAFHNTTPCARSARLVLPMPARGAIYDEFAVLMEGQDLPVTFDAQSASATAVVALAPGESRRFSVRYNSRGLDRWSYSFGSSTTRARDFQLKVATNFDRVDFPDGTLSPSHKQSISGGWNLTWGFGNILADTSIAVAMPHRINPGPLAAEIALFAPVSLAFFFFVLLLVSVMKQVRLHPVHYAMLASAFFAFHLLLAYLVDLVPLWLAFSLASTTSVGLVVSYLRLAVGSRFAVIWAGGAQLLYLVLFSFAFFFEGYTGLSITIFSVLTLFVVMQLTGRIDWSSRFGGNQPGEAPRPSGPGRPPYGTALRTDAPQSEVEGAFSHVA